jgi:hypothetical protein
VEDDPAPVVASRSRLSSWLPRVLVESALIVFSVLFALGVDEWRDHRATVARGREALAAITAELQSNREAANRAAGYHAEIKKRLQAFAEAKQLPDAETMSGGVFQPATLLETAWVTARETGALDQVPFDVVLDLSRIYEHQAKYVSLSSALGNDIYIDLRRRGFEQAMRENFQGFVLLDADFSNREAGLVRRYDAVLTRLAALPQ